MTRHKIYTRTIASLYHAPVTLPVHARYAQKTETKINVFYFIIFILYIFTATPMALCHKTDTIYGIRRGYYTLSYPTPDRRRVQAEDDSRLLMVNLSYPDLGGSFIYGNLRLLADSTFVEKDWIIDSNTTYLDSMKIEQGTYTFLSLGICFFKYILFKDGSIFGFSCGPDTSIPFFNAILDTVKAYPDEPKTDL